MNVVLVRNADRMMTSASPLKDGIEITFADGRKGLIPFADLPGVKGLSDLAGVELSNPYVAVLRNAQGETVELPWDFARHYSDPSYRPRVEAVALAGRQTIGRRIRLIRESSGMTQDALARAAGIGRVTLVRLEKGDQSPRYETLVSLAQALGLPIRSLLVEGTAR